MNQSIMGTNLQKELILSRYIDVFKMPGGAYVIESFTSFIRKYIDLADIALLRKLSDGLPHAPEDFVDIIPDDNGMTVSESDIGRKMSALWEIGAAYAPGEEPSIWDGIKRTCSDRPFVDFVEVTNLCNAQCIMCGVAKGMMRRPRGCMSLQLFDIILKNIGPRQNSRPLVLHNSGEPLLHPDIVTIVHMASKASVPVEISTNPGLLTIELYKRLVDAGIARIVISVDGMDECTLLKIRGEGVKPYDAFRNIENILNERAAAKTPGPALIMQMIKMKINEHQHREFIERFGSMRDNGVYAFLKELDAPLDSDLFASGGKKQQFFCASPWQSIGIFWDGSVVPCCFDSNASLKIGEIGNNTIDEIWNGDRIRELRMRLSENRCRNDELCSICQNRPDRYKQPDLELIPEYPDAWH
jgi:radical SAM protein with 4Fe4S-binding SPASM domain